MPETANSPSLSCICAETRFLGTESPCLDEGVIARKPRQSAAESLESEDNDFAEPTRRLVICSNLIAKDTYCGRRFDPVEDVEAVELPDRKWVCGPCVTALIADSRPKEASDPTRRANSSESSEWNTPPWKQKKVKRPAWSGR